MIVSIHTGPITHLDHLAPLSDLLNIPLIVTEKTHFELGKKFYPMIELNYIPLAKLTLEYLANHFDTIITCGKFWGMELKPLIQSFFQKEIQFIFAPHGYSDKESLLDSPIDQEIEFVYSPQLKEGKTRTQIEMGNIRYSFYKKYKAHFDRLASPFFNEKKKTVLYAPSWKTKANPTSFFKETERIINDLSKEYHLLIKLHPLLEENDPVQFHRIIGKYSSIIPFIEEFPPIYPLLEKTDIYLGDYSSIGYDFLIYDRPMFFLSDRGKLLQCGQFYQGDIKNPQKELSSVRKKRYFEVFDDQKDPRQIKGAFQKITQEGVKSPLP